MSTKWFRRTVLTKTCARCEKAFETRESRARFCSQSCSTITANQNRGQLSETHKANIGKALQSFWAQNPSRKIRGKQAALNAAKGTKGKFKLNAANIYCYSSRTRRKIIERLELKCFRCGWNDGACDIHHVYGRRCEDPHNHKKLTLLCPNCHRLAGEKKIDDKSLPTFHDVVGDKWRDLYFG